MRLLPLALAVAALALAVGGAQAVQDKGIVYLGEETWDKVIHPQTHVLVSVDREYPYGTKHDAFKKAAGLIANAGPSARNLLVVGLPVSLGRTGFEVNARLAQEGFGIKPSTKDGVPGEPEDLPKLFFLPAGGQPETDAVAYTGDREDGDAIARWAADQAGVFVGLKGQVRELDLIGRRLLAVLDGKAEASSSSAEAILDEAKTAANAQPTELKEFVEYYVKVLGRAVEKGKTKGKEWVSTEEARLRRVAGDASVAETKRDTMRWRANVLAGLLKPVGDGDERGKEGSKAEL